jgi:hypothetical protein
MYTKRITRGTYSRGENMKKLAVVVPWDSKFMFTHTAFNLMNMQVPEGYEIRYIMGEET